MRTPLAAAAVLLLLTASLAQADSTTPPASKPTLFIVGDSTVKNGTRGQAGWGDFIAPFFNTDQIQIINRARGGRSSRTFQTEGLWEKVLGDAKPGDFVLIQMGHNDAGPLDDTARARGTIRGIGDESREIDNPITHQKEVVHTYGWYLRKYIADARAHGMTPIICSPVPHCPQKPVNPGDKENNRYGGWAREVATAEHANFIDLNQLIMDKYAGLPPEQIKKDYFTTADNTHTSQRGAELNASCVIAGLHLLPKRALASYLRFDRPTTLPGTPVSMTQTDSEFRLDNGIVIARINKRSGNLVSLTYGGLEMLSAQGGYWSHNTSSGNPIARVTIDPATNTGERAEIAIKATSGGKALGSGPGGSMVADIEIRYALGRGESGVCTYCSFEHPASYPATSIGEARYCAKLNDSIFDWLTVDQHRNKMAITAFDWNHGEQLNMKEARRMTTGLYKGEVEHKYDLTGVQFDTPAFGWSSTKQHVGIWFINPSMEYLSGGPTKVEFFVHRDATFGNNPDAPAPPCILNYWRGSHYGGSSCVIAAGESWKKVVGPFMIYCNAGASPYTMWCDALAKANTERQQWPYEWVSGVDYPHQDQRGGVTGRLVLQDPQAADLKLGSTLIGLAAPDYTVKGPRGQSARVDWQLDAKNYEFWTWADGEGRFKITNVRPGRYTLHAIDQNVLGEYAKADVTVTAAQQLNLGELVWTPIRFGRQIWEIGKPDRTAAEFFHGDHYWQWGLYNDYPSDFPDDVSFVIGKSNPAHDWNYCQCPRADRPKGTTWHVIFDLPAAPKGKATLRLSLAATSARRIDVSVNDAPAGSSGPLADTAVIRRDGIRGYWREVDVSFDASMLHKGTNSLGLTIPPGNPTAGVEYDYVRLELTD